MLKNLKTNRNSNNEINEQGHFAYGACMKIIATILPTILTFYLQGCSLSPHWKTYTYFDPSFSLESPYPLVSKWPPTMVFAAKSQSLNDNFQVGIGTWKARTNLNLNKLTETMVKNFEGKNGFSNLRVDFEPTTYLNCPAVMTEGSLKFRSKPMKMKLLTMRNNNYFWQVSIFYQDKNKEFEEMANRVINSFRFLN
jgi:hypothetical protein